jgi:branched-chain amino acid aminotransferase
MRFNPVPLGDFLMAANPYPAFSSAASPAPLTGSGIRDRIEARTSPTVALSATLSSPSAKSAVAPSLPAQPAMPLQIYISGKFYDKENAKVSVYDHGFLYGDGVFEGLRSYGGKVFRLSQHLDRLWASAKAIWLEIPISREEMAKAVNDTLAKNNIQDGYVRLVVTRGAGALGLDPNKCSNPQIIVIADHIQLYPKEMYENGLEIITASTIRNHSAALSPRIKSLNYLNNIMAKIEGLQAGCVEALMLNAQGEVAECTGDNIFIVRKGVLQTPPTDAGILEGITREAVMELAAEMQIPVQQTSLTRHDIFICDECFLTGSAAEVIPVVKLDSRVIGNGQPGPITKKLTERFHQLTRE